MIEKRMMPRRRFPRLDMANISPVRQSVTKSMPAARLQICRNIARIAILEKAEEEFGEIRRAPFGKTLVPLCR
jgi:hypothetical protein